MFTLLLIWAVNLQELQMVIPLISLQVTDNLCIYKLLGLIVNGGIQNSLPPRVASSG